MIVRVDEEVYSIVMLIKVLGHYKSVSEVIRALLAEQDPYQLELLFDEEIKRGLDPGKLARLCEAIREAVRTSPGMPGALRQRSRRRDPTSGSSV